MTAPRQGSIGLADGRTLAWAAYGAEAGRPVLFVAGAAMGRSMTFGEDVLDELGATLITADRPGIGHSTPDAGRSLSSTAADYAVLAQHWGGPLPVVANSQGAPFGLACAASGLAERLVLVSPIDDIAVEPARSALPDQLRTLVDTVRDDPEEAEMMFAALGPRDMEQMVVGSADDGDKRVYTEGQFLARYRRALDEGFAHGGVGYAADTRIAMSPWTLNFDQIDCEVVMLMGRRDRHHTHDLGAGLTARIPSATRTIIDEAGGALLWTHAELVLRAALGGAGEHMTGER